MESAGTGLKSFSSWASAVASGCGSSTGCGCPGAGWTCGVGVGEWEWLCEWDSPGAWVCECDIAPQLYGRRRLLEQDRRGWATGGRTWERVCVQSSQVSDAFAYWHVIGNAGTFHASNASCLPSIPKSHKSSSLSVFKEKPIRLASTHWERRSTYDELSDTWTPRESHVECPEKSFLFVSPDARSFFWLWKNY